MYTLQKQFNVQERSVTLWSIDAVIEQGWQTLLSGCAQFGVNLPGPGPCVMPGTESL